MAKTRSHANSKGGVGKTTETEETGHNLAEQGRRVLLIDLDGQCSLTKNLGLLPANGQPTIFAVLTEPGKDANRAVVEYHGTARYPVRYPKGGGLFLIPGARSITRAKGTFDSTRDRQPVGTYDLVMDYVIRTWLQGFDDILLDLSPDPDNPNNDAALFASEEVIAPISVESMSIDGVLELMRTLKDSNAARLGLGLRGQADLRALVPSKVMPDQVDRAREVIASLEQNHIPHFGDLYVPYTTAGWKAPDERVPIAVYQPGDAAAEVYRQITQKLL
jgi:chromosome partitioning protein